MQQSDVQSYRERYSKRLSQFGHSPESLGWGGGTSRQVKRFESLTRFMDSKTDFSLLDVGCGFGDLCGFLRRKGWKGKYLGVDLVPDLIQVARNQNYANSEFVVSDASVNLQSLGQYDFVVASGIFNAKLSSDNLVHIEMTLTQMWESSKQAVVVDFMTNKVDFQAEGSWHTDPAIAYQIGKRISKKVVLLDDYLDYEYVLSLFR
jgi:SAM-dependent methyltransferase